MALNEKDKKWLEDMEKDPYNSGGYGLRLIRQLIRENEELNLKIVALKENAEWQE